MIRKVSLCMVLVMLLCLSASAMAATGETGESVNYDGEAFRVYDTEAIAFINEDTEYNGVKVSKYPEMTGAGKKIASSLQKKLDEGALVQAWVVGYEQAGTLEQQITTALKVLGEAAVKGSPKMSVYASSQMGPASTKCGIGYVLRGSKAVPYVRLVIKVVYPDAGEYAGLTLEQRTAYENYTFIYNASTGEFELVSIMSYNARYVY